MHFNSSKKEDKGLSCTLNILSSYSGFGIDGQDLGSGTFTDSVTVFSGNKLYESSDGHWSVSSRDMKNSDVIISINEITEDDIRLIINDQKTIMKYNSKKYRIIACGI